MSVVTSAPCGLNLVGNSTFEAPGTSVGVKINSINKWNRIPADSNTGVQKFDSTKSNIAVNSRSFVTSQTAFINANTTSYISQTIADTFKANNMYTFEVFGFKRTDLVGNLRCQAVIMANNRDIAINEITSDGMLRASVVIYAGSPYIGQSISIAIKALGSTVEANFDKASFIICPIVPPTTTTTTTKPTTTTTTTKPTTTTTTTKPTTTSTTSSITKLNMFTRYNSYGSNYINSFIHVIINVNHDTSNDFTAKYSLSSSSRGDIPESTQNPTNVAFLVEAYPPNDYDVGFAPRDVLYLGMYQTNDTFSVFKLKFYDYLQDKAYDTCDVFIVYMLSGIEFKICKIKNKELGFLMHDAYIQGYIPLSSIPFDPVIYPTIYGDLTLPNEVLIKYDYCPYVPEWNSLQVREYELSLTCYIKNLPAVSTSNTYLAAFNKAGELCGVSKMINTKSVKDWNTTKSIQSNLLFLITLQTTKKPGEYDLFTFKLYTIATVSGMIESTMYNINNAVIMTSRGVLAPGFNISVFNDYNSALLEYNNIINTGKTSTTFMDASTLNNLVGLTLGTGVKTSKNPLNVTNTSIIKPNNPTRQSIDNNQYMYASICYINNLNNEFPVDILRNNRYTLITTTRNEYEFNASRNMLSLAEYEPADPTYDIRTLLTFTPKDVLAFATISISSKSVLLKYKYYDYSLDKIFELNEAFYVINEGEIVYKFKNKELGCLMYDAFNQGYLPITSFTLFATNALATLGDIDNPLELSIKYIYCPFVTRWKHMKVRDSELSLTCYIKNLSIIDYKNSYLAIYDKNGELCGVNNMININDINGWNTTKPNISNLLLSMSIQTTKKPNEYELYTFKFYNRDNKQIYDINNAVIMTSATIVNNRESLVSIFNDYNSALAEYNNLLLTGTRRTPFINSSKLDNLVGLTVIGTIYDYGFGL